MAKDDGAGYCTSQQAAPVTCDCDELDSDTCDREECDDEDSDSDD